ncbi:carboxypeptidase regulatory-like domain-containing protein [Telluribacter sp. SYSU D00476]|uniref:carboxypeptidase regulatory-like domain-containing protein n=1 Tax=Telluribacter sp. SYSU D00476 TaxID=2811430 RepID=UPI001FF67005|nr:carboxypeptidase regulatory-like domain-containing protein [Telluribacter sp. SYSU D00476]
MLLGGGEVHAQINRQKQQADRSFFSQLYGRAINDYVQLLRNDSLATEDRREVLYNLGYAYKEVGDMPKAETVFRQFLESGEPGPKYQQAYLYYAQVLGYNGKLDEAQKVYTVYQEQKDKLTTSSGTGTRVAGGAQKATYRLENLNINSTGSEFSPAYFRDGLVYIAGRGAGGASTNNKGYLDLYYMPRRTDLQAVSLLGADGKEKPLTISGASTGTSGRLLGRDNYTRSTSNDSRTVGTYAPIEFSEGLDLKKPVASTGATVEQFSKDLNSKYHEGPVTFSADGSQIIFTRNNYSNGRSRKSSDNVTKLKLYSATLKDGGWSDVQELPFNHDEYSTGHPALSRDGKLLFFASDRPGGLGGTDLYVSRWEKNAWSKPQSLGKQINTGRDEMFPFVDENGNLYFASNGRKPGLGGLDIYYVPMLNGNVAGPVVHLEAPLNSPADDFGLITDGNRSTGYLSSNRLRGDDDIFRFVQESTLNGCRNLTIRIIDESTFAPLDSAMVVINAKGEGHDQQELFTNANGEVNVCLNANSNFMFEVTHEGYLAGTIGFTTTGFTDDKSTRLEYSLLPYQSDAVEALPASMSGGYTNDKVTTPTLRGTVTGETDKKPIEGVKIILRNKCDGTTKQTVTGPDGRFEFGLKEGCEYQMEASKPSYGTNRSSIRKITEKSESKLVAADLKMLKVGDVVTLDNIYYDSGKWEIRPDAARELDKMVATMRKYPSLRIEIGSHTDSQGNAQFNQYLSERRARAALNYMASKGIARNRMTSKGYGESSLINQCKDGVLCTQEEHQRNRRTEFKVLFIR